MKNLINLLERKKNTKVLVNGTVYEIGPDGVAEGVKDADAEKLLQNERVWKIYDPRRVSAQKAQAKKEFSGKMRLLDVNGNPVGNLPPDTPGPSMDPLDEVYSRLDSSTEGPPPVPEFVVDGEGETGKEEEGGTELESGEGEEEQGEEEAEGEESEEEEEGSEETGVEWPDPDESMSIGFLRKMAKAYEVRHTEKTSKASLIKKINRAMYEEE